MTRKLTGAGGQEQALRFYNEAPRLTNTAEADDSAHGSPRLTPRGQVWRSRAAQCNRRRPGQARAKEPQR